MKKRGEIGLSMNFLVVIILSLVILGFGVTFLYTLFDKSGEAQGQLDAKTRAELESLMLDQGKKVALPFNVITLNPGEEHILGLGILNAGKEKSNFKVVIQLDKIFDDTGKDLSAERKINLQEWLLYSSDVTKIPPSQHQNSPILIKIPQTVFKGKYIFDVKILDSSGQVYGNPQKFTVNVLATGNLAQESVQPLLESKTTALQPESAPVKKCVDDLSCDYYFIYVPLGSWPKQELFAAKVEERARFFLDISEFKFKKVGSIALPLDFVKKCNLAKFNQQSATDHLKIKSCADKYADSLGIEYEKAIGLSNSFDGGKAFFRTKSVYSALGFSSGDLTEERPAVVAHELGHSYSLCDEYSFQVYQTQNRYFKSNTCRNKFPEDCSKTISDCLGNHPSYRDYEGAPVLNVCDGEKHYSVMGFSTGKECGYDNTGGYRAIGDFQ